MTNERTNETKQATTPKICALCGGLYSHHRAASDNSEPFCMDRLSMRGDRFIADMADTYAIMRDRTRR